MSIAIIRISSAGRKFRRARALSGSAAWGIVVTSTVSHPCRLEQAVVYPRVPLCYRESRAGMQTEDIKVSSRSNPSQRIIALGIVFAFLYWASSIVMTLLLAVLLAYFLDPVVNVLAKLHIPRSIGALFALLAMTSIGVGLGYLLVIRADQFAADSPLYTTALR